MQKLFNKKIWLMAVPLAMLMAGCSGDDNKGAGGGGGGAPDITAPTVSSTNPADAATGVAINRSVTTTFSEEMDAATITPTTFTVTQGATPVPGAVTYAGAVATFNPTSDLTPNTVVRQRSPRGSRTW